MAQYHKIPQNVIAYQGRIIGNFTAKQFIFLAIGAIGAFLIFQSPLNLTIKIVSIIIIMSISVLFSVANFQGKTTDIWLQCFSKAINEPTQRIWRKAEYPPEFLLPAFHVERKKAKARKKSVTELERFIEFWRPIAPIAELTSQEKEILKRIQPQPQIAEISTPPTEVEISSAEATSPEDKDKTP